MLKAHRREARCLVLALAAAIALLACGARTGDLDDAFAIHTRDAGVTDSPSCQLAEARVFLTSRLFDGNLGGVRGADAKCTALADAQKLGGSWRAWLTDRNVGARDHIYAASGGYILIDGTRIASSVDALVSGSIEHAIDLTETGRPITDGNTEVWTGTSTGNTGGSDDRADYCADGAGNDWSSNDRSGRFPSVGHSNATDETWTAVYLQYCNRTNVRLYCFEACP